jgi:Coenzyme F420 hydrogenase/dehydrogenase, beta subunit C terminus
VHIKHTDGTFEKIPYFSLPANDLNDVIAPSCYSCFDYTNAGADLVVGYMAVPWQNRDMTAHMQHVTVRCRSRSKRGESWLGTHMTSQLLFSSMSLASCTCVSSVQQSILCDGAVQLILTMQMLADCAAARLG